MKRIQPTQPICPDSAPPDLTPWEFKDFIWHKEHRCLHILHIASHVEPLPDRAFRVHLVEAGSGKPLSGVQIWTDWGTVGEFEVKEADYGGNATLHMSQFWGPCRYQTQSCFTLWIQGIRVGEYLVHIGDDVEIEVPTAIVRAAYNQFLPSSQGQTASSQVQTTE